MKKNFKKSILAIGLIILMIMSIAPLALFVSSNTNIVEAASGTTVGKITGFRFGSSLSMYQIKLVWNKADNADGYIIYEASRENGPYEKVITVKGQNKTSTNAYANVMRTKYYKVRAYKQTASGKVYGSYSKILCHPRADAIQSRWAKAYNNVIKTYEKKYGKIQQYYFEDTDEIANEGVCYLDLCDYDDDLVPELVLVYGEDYIVDKIGNKNYYDWKYHYAIFAFDFGTGKAKKLKSGITRNTFTGTNYKGAYIGKFKIGYRNVLGIGENQYDRRYYAFNGKLETIHLLKIKVDYNNNTAKFYVDGKEVTSNQWLNEYESYDKNRSDFCLFSDVSQYGKLPERVNSVKSELKSYL